MLVFCYTIYCIHPLIIQNPQKRSGQKRIEYYSYVFDIDLATGMTVGTLTNFDTKRLIINNHL